MSIIYFKVKLIKEKKKRESKKRAKANDLLLTTDDKFPPRLLKQVYDASCCHVASFPTKKSPVETSLYILVQHLSASHIVSLVVFYFPFLLRFLYIYICLLRIQLFYTQIQPPIPKVLKIRTRQRSPSYSLFFSMISNRFSLIYPGSVS